MKSVEEYGFNINKRYQIIYADPPWTFKTYSDKGKRAKFGAGSYPTMSDEDICNLPIKDISDDNCILFIWATFPKLESVFKVIKSWGFKYKTCAFTWVKKNPNGVGDWLGLGYWTRANAEICLLATKGNIKRINSNIKQIVFSPRREHSRKPDEIRDNIIKLVGDLPRIELFARQRYEGWNAWGNEVPSDIQMNILKGVKEEWKDD